MTRILMSITLCILTNLGFAQNTEKERYLLIYENRISNIERFEQVDIKAFNEVENIHLYGTLLMPKTPFEKVVILIPGSGADSRENHFKLAEELLLNNMAVFRYDERGVSESEGEYGIPAYSINEMTEDLSVLFQNLQANEKVKGKKIGLIAHSFGGIISIDAVNKMRINPDFLIQWATPVQSFGESLKYQLKNGIGDLPSQFKYDNLEDAYKIMDIFHEALATTKDTTTLKQDIKILKEAKKKAKKEGYTRKRHDMYYYTVHYEQKSFIKKDFERMYTNLTIPTLYIIGTEDIYVDPIAEVNTLKSLNNKNIDIKVFDKLNHYLTADPNLKLGEEMYHIEPAVSSYIINWIKQN